MAESAAAELATSGAALALALQRRQSLRQALTLVAEHAAAGVPGVDCAAVAVLRRGGRSSTVVGTDETARALTEAQLRLGEGPVPACAEAPAGDGAGMVRVADAGACRGWPGFRTVAASHEVRSVLACRVGGGRDQTGALVLYARRASAFDTHAARAAALYGGYASLGLFHIGMVESLKAGLRSRQSIGEATGILMERYKITSPQAFGMLVGASQRLNIKLRDIALRVLETDRSPHEFVGADQAAGGPG